MTIGCVPNIGFAPKEVEAATDLPIVASGTNYATAVIAELKLSSNNTGKPIIVSGDEKPITITGVTTGTTGTIVESDSKWIRVSANDSTNYGIDGNFENYWFNNTANGNAGEVTSSGANNEEKQFTFDVGANGTYWFKTSIKNGDAFYESIVIDNVYTKPTIYIKGTAGNSTVLLYSVRPAEEGEVTPTDYGIAYDLDGTLMATTAGGIIYDPLKYEFALVRVKQPEWGGYEFYGSFHRDVRLDDTFKNGTQYGSTTKKPLEFKYIKDVNAWVDVQYKGVDTSGNELSDFLMEPAVENLAKGQSYDREAPTVMGYTPTGYYTSDNSEVKPLVDGKATFDVNANMTVYFVYATDNVGINGKVIIAGTKSDEMPDGVPIPNVTLKFTNNDTGVVYTAKSNINGDYEVTGVENTDELRGSYSVTTVPSPIGEGFQEYVGTFTVTNSDPHDIEISLNEDTGLSYILVVDEDGVPQANATVVIEGKTYITNSKGRTIAVNLAAPGSHVAFASKTGFIPATEYINFEGNEVYKDITITLKKNLDEDVTGSIWGYVTDKGDGSRVEGVTVTVLGGGSATTDSNGFYVIHDVPIGVHTLLAQKDGYDSGTGIVEVEPYAFVQKDLEISKTGTKGNFMISGKVVDEKTGSPITGAKVEYDEKTGSPITGAKVEYDGKSTTTDEFGYYVLGYFAEGATIQPKATANTYVSSIEKVENITADTTVDFKLKRAVNITVVGRVVGGKGKEFYRYTLTKEYSDTTPVAITSNYLPKYRVLNPTTATDVVPAYRTEEVMPNKNKIVLFEYEWNMTSVDILAYDIDTNEPIEGFTSFDIEAEVGYPFDFKNQLGIPGYDYVETKDNGHIEKVAQTGSSIILYYRKQVNPTAGQFYIIAQDIETNEIIGVKPNNDLVNKGDTFEATDAKALTSADIEVLQYYNLVPNSASPANTTYNGYDSPENVTYKYERIKNDYVVELWDYVTKEKIPGEGSVVHTEPTGKWYTVHRPAAPSGYAVIEETGNVVNFVLEPGEPHVVKFWYMPTTKETINVKAVWDNNGTEVEIAGHSQQLIGLKGDTATVSAPPIPGYTLTSANTVTATFGTDNEVKFVYKKEMVKVTVEYRLNDEYGEEIAESHVNEYQKDVQQLILGKPIANYIIQEPFAYSQAFTEDTTIVFTYKKINDVVEENTVDVVIKGVNKDTGEELYSYTVTKPTSDETFEVEAIKLNKYELVSPAKVELKADGSTPEYTFEYTSLETTVTIIAALDEAGTMLIPGTEAIQRQVIKGEDYVAFAPHIAGYNLVGDVSQELQPVMGEETIVFVYKLAEGNVAINLIDKETGTVIKTVSDEVTFEEGSKLIPIPDLSSENWSIAEGETAKSVDYSTGVTTIDYYYVKDERNVAVYVSIDGVESSEPETVVAYKVDSMQTINAPSVANAKLVDPSEKVILVTPGTDNQKVVFNYTTTKKGEVVVKAVCGSEIIQEYVVITTEGSTVTANAPTILGYKLKKGEPTTVTVQAPGEIIFKYEKDEVTVTVSYKSGKETVKENVTYQVKKGDDLIVYAPHIAGYVLDGADSKTFTDLEVNANHTFNYKPLEDVIKENTVDVLIEGKDKDTGDTLYSYTITQLKSDETFTVEAFDLNKYVLADGSEKEVQIKADGSVLKHTFEYASLEATVTIIAQLQEDPSQNITVERPAVLGEPYTAQAPHIRGYNLVSRSRLSVGSVSGDEELVFEYAVSEGNVNVVLIDSETNKVIKTESEDVTVGDGTKVIAIPDLTEDNYSVKKGQLEKRVTYSPTTQTVEYYYVKNQRNVEVYTLYNGVETLSYTTKYDIESVQNILAPVAPTGSKLAEPSSKTVLIEEGTGAQKVVFEYTTILDGDVIVNAVYDGQIIQSFTVSTTKGSEVTATAPIIQGYKLKDGQLTTQIGTAPEILNFLYEKDEVAVTVSYKSKGVTIQVDDTYQVAKGGDKIVYAPYIKGYTLSGINLHEFTGVTTAARFTFNYDKIETEQTETTDVSVKFIDIDGNVEIGQEFIKNVTAGETYSYEYPSLETAGYNFIYSNPTNNGKTIDIILAESNNEILVYYDKKKADVTVNHYDNNTGNLLHTETIKNQKVGTMYTANYYDTDNYYYYSGKSQIVVANGSNVINIYYINKNTVPAGSVVIEHVDQQTGVILKTEIITELNSSKDNKVANNLIDETDLDIEITSGSAVKMTKNKMAPRPLTAEKVLAVQYEYNTATEQEVINIKNLGYDLADGDTVYTIPVDTSITIEYVSNISKIQSVTVEYYDATNGKIIETVQKPGILNTLYVPYIKYFDNYKFSSIEPSGGVLVTTGVNKVRVNYSEIEDPNSIKVPAILIINYKFNDEVIYSTTLHGFVGDEFNHTAEDTLTVRGHNYKLLNGSDIFKSIVLKDGINILDFNYEEIFDDGGDDNGDNGGDNGDGGNSGGGGSGGGGGGITPIPVPDIKPIPDTKPTPITDTGVLGLETVSHIKYINGYPDGTFRPKNGLTRAEAAAILFNLSTKIDKTKTYSNSFSDVPETSWCYNPIGALSEMGILSGYLDGTFRPNAQITRAEFVALLVRAQGVTGTYEPIFADVSQNHWASNVITIASKNGWVNGYENKEFRPNNSITRAEAVVIVNNVLNRKITKDEASKVENPFADISANHWAYQDVIEASKAHDYERLESGHEQWKINQN